jgi:ABC-type nitrate/sulfonate/bicarbonate transport system substrate-binding protein
MGLTTVRIGFLPLVDIAVLVAAQAFGFAEAQGLRLELSREASWANIRDKPVYRHFDTAHMLAGLPPPLTVDALRAGEIAGFCVGEPWSSSAVAAGAGHIVALGCRIWQRGVEKVLGVRFARWAGDAANRPALAAMMARPELLDRRALRSGPARRLSGGVRRALNLGIAAPAMT